jgi:hypothetical protein
VKPSPAGYNRAYVRSDVADGLDGFYENWKAGRNFVTNGPMLFLKTDADLRPGDSIELKQEGGEVALKVEVYSRVPLTSVEVVVNGRVSHVFEIDDKNIFKGEVTVEIDEGSWIAARCTSRDGWLSEKELSVYTRGPLDYRFPTRPSRLRFAHTSPIYVTVGERGAAVVSSIEEGLRMMDSLEAFTREHAEAKYQPATIQEIEMARVILREKLEQANAVSPSP